MIHAGTDNTPVAQFDLSLCKPFLDYMHLNAEICDWPLHAFFCLFCSEYGTLTLLQPVLYFILKYPTVELNAYKKGQKSSDKFPATDVCSSPTLTFDAQEILNVKAVLGSFPREKKNKK